MLLLAAPTPMDWLQVGIRFFHILAAIAGGGAVLFQWFALHPALRTTSPDLRPVVAAAIADRWRAIAYTVIVLLLATGLINFMVFQIPAYQSHPQKGVYHALFGIKVLAALMFFHGATVLSLPGEKGAQYRTKAGGWLTWLTLLLVVIVAAGAVLRNFNSLFPPGAAAPSAERTVVAPERAAPTSAP
jgi:hypothetical protein